ncbi:phage tail protein [Staphylococcus muscae]|uniref:Bacteriophage protein n=1 Tax=Staphylococcus muscae TaxID=1294 RepID=A0A240BZ38_9STAP|nr:distal tail protein Dit [Staphylococcus muscae]AVQ34425.1 phage tail protein [Staphylococcus muscae]PNZ02879.1 phage tail protein [Staphylococcus muscae]GGA93172.1 phage tail protein [Staphylococcus muscae]SNW00749.1 bacteriophage protein [Staphylococcus muscae]
MNDTIKVNDKALSWLYVQRGFQIPSFNFEIETEKVEGRAGSVFKRRQLSEYRFEIPLVVHNDKLSAEGIKTHDDINNALAKFFDYNEAVKLQFKSKNWYWNARFEGPFEINNKTENNINVVNVKVVLTDPYKYSATGNTNTAIGDAVSVVNLGTAPTPITVEARALKDSTNFMIANGDKDYFMIGKSEDANKTTKDVAPFLFDDEFSRVGLSNWAYMPDDTSFGRYLDGGDAMGGRFQLDADGDSIFPKDWGKNTKTDWHGAAIYKSLSKSVRDFRVRFKVGARHDWGVGTGKSVAYLVDENGRLMFSVSYVNSSVTSNSTQIVVYAYDEHESPRKIYSRSIPHRAKNMPHIHAFIFLERQGKNIKITNYFYDKKNDRDRLKPIFKDEKVVVDGGGLYQRGLRICRMYIGKSSRYPKHLHTYIMGFSVQELLPEQDNIVPIVIRRGDDIVIDTAKKLVTVNDENALHLKDFGSNYFNIDTGTSELVIYPPNTFDTTVKWQDRFL